MKNSEKTLDMIVNLCKNRGFVFAGSEIYGGLANSWDYGPLGVEFKNNVKKAWLKKFVQESPYNVGLDAAIIMNPQTWITTGHVASFSDPLLDCKACKARHRADKLIGDEHPEVNVDAMSFDEMDKFIAEHEDVVCPVCGKHDFTPIRKFNLMFKTAIGVTEDSSSTCYLRPETAQGIFVNFANIQRTTRRKLPFGVCQIGKAFRNEITPGNFTFRTREFEQMECEFFCKPDTDLEWFAYWKDYCKKWLLSLGIKEENLRLRDHEPAELAFYSRATTDIEYAFPFTDWGELWGIAGRTNYDLGRHQEASGKSLEYFDPEIPPTAKIQGIDLVTEGVLTMSRTVEILREYVDSSPDAYYFKKLDAPNGAAELAKVILEDCTCLRLFVGTAINPAHQNPNLPSDLSIKGKLIDEIASLAKRLGKSVEKYTY